MPLLSSFQAFLQSRCFLNIQYDRLDPHLQVLSAPFWCLDMRGLKPRMLSMASRSTFSLFKSSLDIFRPVFHEAVAIPSAHACWLLTTVCHSPFTNLSKSAMSNSTSAQEIGQIRNRTNSLVIAVDVFSTGHRGARFSMFWQRGLIRTFD